MPVIWETQWAATAIGGRSSSGALTLKGSEPWSGVIESAANKQLHVRNETDAVRFSMHYVANFGPLYLTP
jgi:hypothetical protein